MLHPKDLLVVVALNSSVAAVLKKTGKMLWQTDLPGFMGDRFVTITADDTQVYACAKGRMHCLDLETGRILWTNELKGLGYGIASICIPGLSSAPDPVVHAQIEKERRSGSASNPPPAT